MRLFIIIIGLLGFMAVPRLIRPPEYTAQVQSAIDYFREESRAFAGSCTDLRRAVEALRVPSHPGTGDEAALIAARQRLVECRRHYKKIESFIEYFFRTSTVVYNRPPKYEAEEPGMEYEAPEGMQVIESMLYEPRTDKHALLEQVKAVEGSAADLPALLYELKADDRQLLESLRIELIRVMALDITGYEAPNLKSGVLESADALESLSCQLQPYLHDGERRSDSLRYFLDKATRMVRSGQVSPGRPRATGGRISGLGAAANFDAFDRLAFLREAALPLQRQLGLFIHEKGLDLNTNKVLNYDAPDLFSPDAILPDNFPGGTDDMGGTLALLGKRLFSDPSLSGNGKKSCASCHSPEKMFTDRLPLSVTLDGRHFLDRNAPTLLYSGFQYKQFWDGRVGSLQQQIGTVLQEPREMNADTATLLQRTGMTVTQITDAIAAYVRSLHPMNSAFDRFMRGQSAALDSRQRKGANLFMGKAQCATCHFIPLFNGLIPPDYALTEFEVLGTTNSDRWATAQPSKDSGRYKVYPLPFFMGAFKTPTVRNAALTYPYMHNGAFRDLKKVMEFYNKGGGAGMELKVPDQTLPSAPLHLTPAEIDDIILFIGALTDSLGQS